MEIYDVSFNNLDKKVGMFKHKTRIGTRNMAGVLLAVVFATATLAACGGSSSPTTTTNQSSGINKIQHVIVIMQENRSFDSYFGTYSGADGIPMQKGASQPMEGLP